jgi:hypothetical protein
MPTDPDLRVKAPFLCKTPQVITSTGNINPAYLSVNTPPNCYSESRKYRKTGFRVSRFQSFSVGAVGLKMFTNRETFVTLKL